MVSRRVAFALLAALAVTPLPAQKTWSPQPRFQSAEGLGSCVFFGAHRQVRFQLADGSVRGRAMGIKRIAYRANYTWHDDATAAGRSWSNVQLEMSEFDMAKMVRNPSANVTGSPTRVFRGSVSWPALRGLSLLRPVVVWSPTFPFSTTFSYSGNRDLLADYRFAGGRLANGASWTRSQRYTLDSYNYGFNANGEFATLGPNRRTGGCIDSGNTLRLGAETAMNVAHYGPQDVIVARRNTVHANYSAFYVGGGAACITALGFKRFARGVAIPGVPCQRLYVDTSGPTVYIAQKASSVPGYGFLPTRYLTGNTPPHRSIPVQQAWIGVPMVMQTAWSDTVNGQLLLTSGVLNEVAAIPSWTNPGQVPRAAVYEYPSGGGTVRAGPTRVHNSNPICCYGR